MELIDGKKVASQIREELHEQIKSMDVIPHLVVILVGNDPASETYVNMKEKDAMEIGMDGTVLREPADISQEDLENLIKELNNDTKINGILVQLPLPDHLDEASALDLISPLKDVDGLHDLNVGRLHNKKPGLRPCTPSGIMELLKRYNVPIEGKRAVVIGRSNLVGKPIARMLEQANATVTVCHSRTKNIGAITLEADIIVVAAGKAGLLTADMVKDGAVVIDVGTNRVDGKLVGDVDFDSVSKKADKITPVPGGVGPMTRAMLLVNTLRAVDLQQTF